MDFKNDRNNDLIKILPLLVSFIFLILLFYVYVRYPFLSVDEGFTRGLLNLNLADMVSVTANDVHPPLYYFINYLFAKLVGFLGLKMSVMHLLEFPALIPYLILLVFSLTKIRKDYGLLTAGIFSLALISMSEFFTYYMIARMYTWTLLFTVIAFYFVKDILEKNNYISWIMLSIFSILAAYCHYFAILSSIALYFMLFIWILFFNEREFIKDNLKKFFTSVMICVVLFMPWLLVMLSQMGGLPSDYWIPQVRLGHLVYYMSYCFTISGNKIIRILSLIVMIAIFIVLFKKFIETKSNHDTFILMGYCVFVGTILVGLIVSLLYRPVLYDRYLLHAVGVLWLAISIKIGDLKLNKTHLLLIIILISVVGAFNVYHEVNGIKHMNQILINETNLFSEINNNNTVIIYDTDNHYIRTHTELDKVYKQFSGYHMTNETYNLVYIGENVTEHTFQIPRDMKDYQDKDIYLLKFYKIKPNFPSNVKAENIGTAQHATFYKLTLK